MDSWEQLRKNVFRGLKIAEVTMLGIGLYVAYQALDVYRDQTKIASINRLDDSDEMLVQMQFNDPHLSTFYAEFSNSLTPRKQADIYLALLAGCGHPKGKPCNAETGSLPSWRTIPDLSCAIFDGADFKREVKANLRKGYLLAEATLYLVARVFERKAVIGQEEYDSWAAYIKNNGRHPLLLSAMHYGYTHGYIDELFWAELQRLLSPAINQQASKMIEVIYPQFRTVKQSSKAGKSECA